MRGVNLVIQYAMSVWLVNWWSVRHPWPHTLYQNLRMRWNEVEAAPRTPTVRPLTIELSRRQSR